MHLRSLVPLTAAALLTSGCLSDYRVPRLGDTLGNAALFGQFRCYDGRTGRPISLPAVARRAAGADVILFGEEHSDAVCNALEAELLTELARPPRRTALAMEFFEADTQAALDAYLAGRLDEAAFRKQARQNRAYVLAHRPLIEYCRAADIPVIAANAPRRLVRAFRLSEQEYDEWRATVEAEDRRWIPVHSTYLPGAYEERFLDMMSGHGPEGAPPATPAPQPASQPASMPAAPPVEGQPLAETPAATAAPDRPPKMPAEMLPHAPPSRPALSSPATAPSHTPPAATQPAASHPTETPPAESQPVETQPAPPSTADTPERFFRAQLMWDDAMAESLAHYRARHPGDRIMLIVGSFHVAAEGGTAVKFGQRRPLDRVFTLVYRGTSEPGLEFDPEDRGVADVVIYGIKPPPEEKKPS